MENTQKKVVTRFAPSPTGMLHVGGIRTALFAYLLAKQHNGTFILRIEDTDKKREVEGAKEQIMASLRFLGAEWDFGPDKPSPVFGSCVQSERLPIYYRYAKKLLETGHAYVDPFTEEETEALRMQAEEEKRPFLYREHRPENLNTDWEIGKPLRFKTGEIKETFWHDLVWGDLKSGPEGLDDFILIKEDGFPTYNFCHIVDDIEMEVTHVMRGEEFIASTPKFLSLYEALGVKPPLYATPPRVLGETGNKKLSKRDGAKSALDYEAEGYLSAALFNFLVFLGFNPGGEKEIYTAKELATVFDLSRVQKSGARFNPEKLDWYNKEYMKKLPVEEVVPKMLSYFTDKEFTSPIIKKRFEAMAPFAYERAVTFKTYYDETILGEYDYLLSEPTLSGVSLAWKKSTPEKAKEVISLILADIGTINTLEEVEPLIRKRAEEQGNGEVLWPLRVALSGKEKSPDPFTLIKVLGLETVKSRLEFAQQFLH